MIWTKPFCLLWAVKLAVAVTLSFQQDWALFYAIAFLSQFMTLYSSLIIICILWFPNSKHMKNIFFNMPLQQKTTILLCFYYLELLWASYLFTRHWYSQGLTVCNLVIDNSENQFSLSFASGLCSILCEHTTSLLSSALMFPNKKNKTPRQE